MLEKIDGDILRLTNVSRKMVGSICSVVKNEYLFKRSPFMKYEYVKKKTHKSKLNAVEVISLSVCAKIRKKGSKMYGY